MNVCMQSFAYTNAHKFRLYHASAMYYLYAKGYIFVSTHSTNYFLIASLAWVATVHVCKSFPIAHTPSVRRSIARVHMYTHTYICMCILRVYTLPPSTLAGMSWSLVVHKKGI